MPAKKITLEQSKEDKLFYVVANVVVYRASDQRCLLLKRSNSEKVHPNKYAVCGGKLEWSDLDINNPTRVNGDVLDYEDAVQSLLDREVFEEAGIKIKKGLKYINNVAYIRPDGIPVLLIKFAAEYLSGEVVLEKGSFTDHIWVSTSEVKNLECIKGVPEEIIQTIKFFNE